MGTWYNVVSSKRERKKKYRKGTVMEISLAISFLSSSREKTRLYRALNWYHRRWMIISLPVSLIPRVSLRSRDRGMQSIRSFTGILLPSSRCSFPLWSRFFLSLSRNEETGCIDSLTNVSPSIYRLYLVVHRLDYSGTINFWRNHYGTMRRADVLITRTVTGYLFPMWLKYIYIYAR